jgi:hypothetical protein
LVSTENSKSVVPWPQRRLTRRPIWSMLRP